MYKMLQYPYDSEYLLKKSKKIKRELLEDGSSRIQKKIAVLGGSTTHDIIRMLELFLLSYGIAPVFYESAYGQYYQDAVFGSEELTSFGPELIYIHTSSKNIQTWPGLTEMDDQITARLDDQYRHFEGMWNTLFAKYHCPIIQNNFEAPFFRVLGNLESYDIHGRIHFINGLNERFYDYARGKDDFYIHDIHYAASVYGLERWADPFYWHMYKYAMCMQAIPDFAFNLSHIIKAIFGKNKKALVLDLDHTLWGGVVGDDGVEKLEIGHETSMGQVYHEFQSYIKAHKDIGVILNVCSKNEKENALAGLNHPEGALRPEDFVSIKANWEPKSNNIKTMARELDLLPDAFVFVDDNPAEREIVSSQVPDTAVPEMKSPEQYIKVLDRSGFFETIRLSKDDQTRSEMYAANLKRVKEQASFGDYESYLRSLSMEAAIQPFEPVYMPRIVQLINKSNQFNLTTKRYTLSELEQESKDQAVMTLYGRLLDKFGDNGIVSVVIGRQEKEVLHIELWLMSCRVLKRDMEYAMMDELVKRCRSRSITRLVGYYFKTTKNQMVKEFYQKMGFVKTKETEDGNAEYAYVLPKKYENKNKVIALRTSPQS